MPQTIEWAHVSKDSHPTLLHPHDEAADGNTPEENEEATDSTIHGIAIEGVVIHGEIEALKLFFNRCNAALESRQIELEQAARDA